MNICLQMSFLNTVQFYETCGRLDSEWCKLAVCVRFELMLTHEIIGMCSYFQCFQ
jgi:hypothetical protein